ncbi:MAG: M23 family metallopeptidase [Alphaproteobacteria bacterium]|nr:M23 family metallopeptidase [Alphaproteobacteria bacterium]
MNAHRSPSRSSLFIPAKRVLVALALISMAACDTTYSGREGTIEYPGSGASPNAVATYVVKEGDTLDGIAARFGVSRDTIAERNGLKSPYRLRPGTNLAVPNARVVDTTQARGVPPPAASPPSGPAPAIGRVEATDLPPVTGAPTPPTSAAPPAVTDPVPRMTPPASAMPAAAPRFEWPLRGRTLAGFGPRAGGQQNDGIDIAAAAGTSVKAADGGTVVYAGNEVRGLGNLLLVSHAGGYITAYAHLDQMSVAKGATVKKGQTIGTVGTSGGASEPQLHFEVRYRNKPVDPAGLLPR